MLNVAFCQNVRCGSKKYAKALSSAENLNKMFTVNFMGRKYNFSAQDSDSGTFFESHQTLTKSYIYIDSILTLVSESIHGLINVMKLPQVGG